MEILYNLKSRMGGLDNKTGILPSPGPASYAGAALDRTCYRTLGVNRRPQPSLHPPVEALCEAHHPALRQGHFCGRHPASGEVNSQSCPRSSPSSTPVLVWLAHGKRCLESSSLTKRVKLFGDVVTFDVHGKATAKRILIWPMEDPWYQVGFVFTSGLNSAYVLGYSGSVMVPLGWVDGTVGFLLAAAVSMYANTLLGRLHLLGGKRHIRYRDLAGHIYGRKMYGLTWALQYVNLFMINTGFIILAGQALKALYLLIKDDGAMKLPYCIAVSGFVCALFAFGIPYLSALRIWLGFSTVFSLIFIVAACVLSLRDGVRSPHRDYSIPGDGPGRVFTTIGASASLVFAYNTGMLPEIQATIRPPVVKNIEKALWFQFTIGVVPIYAVVFIGYWAYGNETSSYLLNSVHGPVWVKALANLSAFLQTVIALHIFASPMYEYLDTRFGSSEGGPFAFHNVMFRVGVRGGYLTVNTLVAAMLPFLGDFMSLTGALSTFPLTFVLANHMYLVANRHRLSSLQKSWHWLNVIGFTVLAVVFFINYSSYNGRRV